jgi:hypothetical protein
VKWAGVAGRSTPHRRTGAETLTGHPRQKTTTSLDALGFSPIVDAFRARGVHAGRTFPSMLKHVRRSIGTAAEETGS